MYFHVNKSKMAYSHWRLEKDQRETRERPERDNRQTGEKPTMAMAYSLTQTKEGQLRESQRKA